jgi:RecG-like helicase
LTKSLSTAENDLPKTCLQERTARSFEHLMIGSISGGSLPFVLTGAQHKALQDVKSCFRTSMNRLLQEMLARVKP